MQEIRCKSCGKSAGQIELRNKKVCTRVYTGNGTLFVYEHTEDVKFYCPNVKCSEYGQPQKILLTKDKNVGSVIAEDKNL